MAVKQRGTPWAPRRRFRCPFWSFNCYTFFSFHYKHRRATLFYKGNIRDILLTVPGNLWWLPLLENASPTAMANGHKRALSRVSDRFQHKCLSAICGIFFTRFFVTFAVSHNTAIYNRFSFFFLSRFLRLHRSAVKLSGWRNDTRACFVSEASRE